MRPSWIRPACCLRHAIGPAVAASLIPSLALAQGLPGSIDPGRIPQQFEAPPRPAPAPAVISREIPEAVTPADAARIKLALRHIVVDGATVYTDAQLQPLYADLLGRTISLADIYRVAEAITTRYRSDGFILARAVVAAQRIVDGDVHIQVVEGFVDRVTVQGDRDTTIQRYADRIAGSRPLKADDLERAMLLINDLPGVTARSVLAPAAGVLGGSELTVIVERKIADVSVSLDNRGTKYSGPLELITEASLNNPFGLSDRIGFQYITTPVNEQELRFFKLDYAVPIGGNGTKFFLAISGSQGMPGSTLQSAFLRTTTSGETVTFGISHPFIRSRIQNLSGDISLTLVNSNTDQFSLPDRTRLASSYNDRIRAIRAGLNYDTTDAWRGRDFVRLELSQGLPIFDASPNGALTNTSRPGGVSVFTRARLDASRLQDLDSVTPGLNLLTALSAGWSFGQSLLASEQFGVGGAYFGRGYDPSELTGDYGLAAKIELQYDVPADSFTGIVGTRLPSLQLFGFCDQGVVADQNPQLLHESGGARAITSVGLGVRTNWTRFFSASLEVDKPLTRPVAAYANTSNPDPFRVFFAIAARF
jgi:hemolysin activation/secretion protein